MEEIPYFETEITKESSPMAIALAKHLHSIGAKLYGAFWCSHCLDQKEVLPFLYYFSQFILLVTKKNKIFVVFKMGSQKQAMLLLQL